MFCLKTLTWATRLELQSPRPQRSEEHRWRRSPLERLPPEVRVQRGPDPMHGRAALQKVYLRLGSFIFKLKCLILYNYITKYEYIYVCMYRI